VSDHTEIYRHPAKPEWGRGILVEEREAKLILHWEDGAEHAVGSAYRDRLELVELDAGEAAELSDRILDLRSRALKALERAAKAKTSRKRTAARPAAKVSFDEQLRRFEAAFPGGFTGEAFERGERGIAGGQPVEGGRQAAVDLARELLAPGAFGDPDAVSEAALRLLGTGNLLHPFEGALRFKTIAPEDRPRMADALRELLHAGGAPGPRFDRFVESLAVRGTGGAPARPTWPLCTIFSGLFDPATHLFVKPKLLLEQAAVVQVTVDYSPLPTSTTYQQFLAAARAVEERLRAAGHQPRDLLDIAAFVSSTLSARAAAAAAPAAPPVPAPAEP